MSRHRVSKLRALGLVSLRSFTFLKNIRFFKSETLPPGTIFFIMSIAIVLNDQVGIANSYSFQQLLGFLIKCLFAQPEKTRKHLFLHSISPQYFTFSGEFNSVLLKWEGNINMAGEWKRKLRDTLREMLAVGGQQNIEKKEKNILKFKRILQEPFSNQAKQF